MFVHCISWMLYLLGDQLMYFFCKQYTGHSFFTLRLYFIINSLFSGHCLSLRRTRSAIGGKVIGAGVHIHIYMFVDEKKF